MPWCPNCKNEYREGMTECSDCHAALVDSLEESVFVPVVFGEEAQMNRLSEFLKYSGVGEVKISYDETDEVYECLVKQDNEAIAKKYAATFLSQEKEQELLDMEEEERQQLEKEEADRLSYMKSGVYKNNADKAKDFSSSAYSLIPVGIIGLLALVGVMTGLIPLRLADNVKIIFYIVMSVMFLIFIGVGISSLKLAKKYEKEAQTEETETNELMGWFMEQYSSESLDEQIHQNLEQEEKEIQYFKRYEKLKQILSEHKPEAAESYIEKIAEDLYQQLYEEE